MNVEIERGSRNEIAVLPGAGEAIVRRWHIRGQVQGVGFRPFVYRLARELGVRGFVRNDTAGVMVEGWGAIEVLDRFERRIRDDAPRLAHIDAIERRVAPSTRGLPTAFRVETSRHGGSQPDRVTVDTSVCGDCLAEMRSARDRRHGHGLVNCTSCGPRYTIVHELPYDRSRTTMAAFPMCDDCAREYGDPSDRRFHAQPVCCPRCGPRVRFRRADGGTEDPPIDAAVAVLREGGILAMKGLGGYHLVVDATSPKAVARLRTRKRRAHKPFAVMVGTLEAAEALVELSEAGRAHLESAVRPVVLASWPAGAAQLGRVMRRCLPGRGPLGHDRTPAEGEGGGGSSRVNGNGRGRAGTGARGGEIAWVVAPGLDRLGIMLPSTPLQHLLFDAGAGPLVMTSGNCSDEPLVIDDAEVEARLGGIHDAVLWHDRPIARAVDDSVLIDAPTGPIPVRRARGAVPVPLMLPVTSDRPGLCAGGELKSVVAVVRGDHAVVSQHLGDLTYTLAFERFRTTLDDLQRLYAVDPEWIACDAHPGYASHVHARRLAAERSVPLLPIQHHHAHLASLLAEHGRVERIVGIVCDGVGYGSDGTAWGGEILVGDLVGAARVGRLRPLRLPGGDAAARDTRRCAASWVFDALGAPALEGLVGAVLFDSPDERDVIAGMLARDLNCPPSSGAGRLFDAAAALVGLCFRNEHEAMSGMLLEAEATHADIRLCGRDLIPITEPSELDGPFELDHRVLVERLVDQRIGAASPGVSAWLFHDALADALARGAARAAESWGLDTVGLSGGVFCNALLTELVSERLVTQGYEVLVHRAIPPNDGGIAYGQAAVAAATFGAPAVRSTILERA